MDTRHARQEALELEQVRLGVAQYHGERMPWQDGKPAQQDEGDSAPGKALLNKYVAPLSAAIELFRQGCADGEAGRKHAAYPYLLHIEPDQAAYLALRVTLNGAAGRKKLATVAEEISIAIEDHINFERMAGTNPGLYKITLERLLQYRAPRQRRMVLSRQLRKYAIERLQWAAAERVLLGTKLIELIEVCFNLISVNMHTEGRHKTANRVEFTEGAEQWLTSMHERAAILSPVHQPMLVPPQPWTSPTEGGYLTGAIRSWLVRVKRKEDLGEYEGIDMPHVYAAVNAIQETPWAINGGVLSVLREAYKAGDLIGGLPANEDTPEPSKPAWLVEGLTESEMTVEQVESFRAWKVRASKVHEENARRRCDRINLARKLHLAEKFAVEPEFYLPCYLDFRSRIYPFCDALSFQGDDATKALLRFARGKALGETGGYWLAVHLANNYANGGLDKLPLDERVAWVEAHTDQILDSAVNPLDGQRFWTTAENPWMFLAACYEWAGFMIEGDEHVSYLPVNMDGSCSGLQHYSALLRDPVGGEAVNLTPTAKASDLYSRVAGRAQTVVNASTDAALAPWRGDRVVRKVVKQPCMTMCYSATKFGMRGQIRLALRKLDEEHGEKWLSGAENYPAASAMADVVWDAIGDVVTAARTGMDFLRECARVATRAGIPVRWTAPSGFVVSQAYVEEIGERVEVHYNGERLRVNVVRDGLSLDTRKQSSGIAPNYVHSLDSSHLMATVLLGEANDIHDWCVVHDSFGCHAADVDKLNTIIRETFVQQYTENLLEKFLAEVREAVQAASPKLAKTLPVVPPMGTLDLDAVRRSDFFFA